MKRRDALYELGGRWINFQLYKECERRKEEYLKHIIEKNYCEIGKKRIEREEHQLELFE